MTTKARKIADIIGRISSNKLQSADLDVSFENISDTGTEGTKVATGTTAQRGSTTGQWRYNTTTNFFEGINNTGGISSLEPDPTILSVDDTEVDSGAGGNQTIVVTGTNFSSGGTISFVGTSAEFNASTTTFNNANQVTAVAPKASFLNAQEPYKVKFTSSTGKFGESATGLINVDNEPTWTTSAGSLGSVNENATGNHFTVAASDADGDTVSYSLQSGSLGGLSLDSSTGVISGDPTDVTSDTTNSFTLRATANSKTADRAFSFITANVPPATGGTTQDYSIGGTNYRSHTFLSNGTFQLNIAKTVDYMIVGGGGAGGSHNIASSTGGGGGGAGGFRTFTSVSLSPASYTATVGLGGSAGVSAVSGALSQNGGDTSFNSQTATGGGRGGARNQTDPTDGSDADAFNAVGNGGSGGGAGFDYPNGYGNGNTPSTSPSQGNNGGTGYGSGSSGGSGYAGGGGGGSGSVGNNHSGGHAGNGGTGTQNNYRTGSNQYYAAGGGGGAGGGSNNGNGGSSIGGNGGNDTYDAVAPTQNTGSGGGGCGGSSNARQATSGANGIIVIRYQI